MNNIVNEFNLLHLHLREGLGPAVSFHAPVVADTALPVVETFQDATKLLLNI